MNGILSWGGGGGRVRQLPQKNSCTAKVEKKIMHSWKREEKIKQAFLLVGSS